MSTLLEFMARIAVVLYVLIAAGIFFALRGLIQSRRRLRVAAFGLEREAAREQQRRALSGIATLLLLAGSIYMIDNIVVPNLSGPQQAAEATPIVFVTQPPTPTSVILLFPTITPTVGIPPAEVAAAGEENPPAEPIDGCEIVGATITSPSPGQSVSGQVLVEGSVNILNFGQYKFELNGPSTGGEWIVVGTYFTAVPAGLLGVWDSTSLLPGDYTLRLIVFRENGSPLTPCEIPIVISRARGEEATPEP